MLKLRILGDLIPESSESRDTSELVGDLEVYCFTAEYAPTTGDGMGLLMIGEWVSRSLGLAQDEFLVVLAGGMKIPWLSIIVGLGDHTGSLKAIKWLPVDFEPLLDAALNSNAPVLAGSVKYLFPFIQTSFGDCSGLL